VYIHAYIRDSFKIFPESLFFFREIKTVKSFKLHFLQNSHLVQLYTSASDCTGVGNIPRRHFVEAFSALPSHS